MDIDNMTPEEINVAVATEIMGWEKEGWIEEGFKGNQLSDLYPWYWRSKEGKIINNSWSPSTDIAAAWQVVEKFLDHYDFDLNNLEANDGEWMATIKPLTSDNYIMAKASTAPLAICRAALRATEK